MVTWHNANVTVNICGAESADPKKWYVALAKVPKSNIKINGEGYHQNASRDLLIGILLATSYFGGKKSFMAHLAVVYL